MRCVKHTARLLHTHIARVTVGKLILVLSCNVCAYELVRHHFFEVAGSIDVEVDLESVWRFAHVLRLGEVQPRVGLLASQDDCVSLRPDDRTYLSDEKFRLQRSDAEVAVYDGEFQKVVPHELE